MLRFPKMLLALGLFAAAAGLVGLSAASADEPGEKGKKGYEKAKKDEPKAAPGDGPKVIVIQLDASKLPPDVLAKLLELSAPGTKPTPKAEPEKKPAPVAAISLTAAIAAAEKAAKGTATKAERKDGKDGGGVQFKIDVTDAKGNKAKVILDAAGKVVEVEKKDEDQKPEPAPTPKKKGKVNDDD